MVQFLSINFFFLDFFNFCWVFQNFTFFLCHRVFVSKIYGFSDKEAVGKTIESDSYDSRLELY